MPTMLKRFMKSYLWVYLSAVIVAFVAFGFGLVLPSPIKDLFISVAGGIWGGVVAAIIFESRAKPSAPRNKK